jgi:predicted nucleotidyltransferase
MTRVRLNNAGWGQVRNQRGLIARSIIRRAARRLAERFQPDKIILFGSYAYGQPSPESDVDFLVVMPARNEIDQSLRIEESLDAPIPLDVIVRTPKNLHWRLNEGDWFLREVMARGEVLYEKTDSRVGAKSRSRSGGRPKNQERQAAAPR